MLASPMTAREAKGPNSECDSGNLVVVPLLEVGARTNRDRHRAGHGIGNPGDPMYTLQAEHQHGVAHTLRAEGCDAGEDGTGRGTPIVAQPTHAIRGGRGVSIAVPRRLTPRQRECERLQGFPDGWTAWGVDESGKRKDMADTPRYRMLGNAVTVNVVEWIGVGIMRFQEQ